jgi:uncharacterized membrane protein YvlD (DUF360 family)
MSAKVDTFWCWLTVPRGNIFVFVVLRSLIGWGTHLPLAVPLFFLDAMPERPFQSWSNINALSLLLIAPLWENLLLVFISAYMRWFLKPIWAAVIGAVVLSLIHSIWKPLLGPLVFPGFVVLAGVYLEMDSKGVIRAYLVSVAMHSLLNVPATAALFALSML